MKITQAIKMAFASICSTKLRSFLTMLGIIIGVMSVTVHCIDCTKYDK